MVGLHQQGRANSSQWLDFISRAELTLAQSLNGLHPPHDVHPLLLLLVLLLLLHILLVLLLLLLVVLMVLLLLLLLFLLQLALLELLLPTLQRFFMFSYVLFLPNDPQESGYFSFAFLMFVAVRRSLGRAPSARLKHSAA